MYIYIRTSYYYIVFSIRIFHSSLWLFCFEGSRFHLFDTIRSSPKERKIFSREFKRSKLSPTLSWETIVSLNISFRQPQLHPPFFYNSLWTNYFVAFGSSTPLKFTLFRNNASLKREGCLKHNYTNTKIGIRLSKSNVISKRTRAKRKMVKRKIEIDSLLRRINADRALFVILNENNSCDVRRILLKLRFSRQKEINDSLDLARRWSGRW